MAESRPQIVFHLAAHHFIPFCDQNPEETLRVNVEGTHAILTAAARHGVRVAVVASSGALYPSRDDLLHEELSSAPVDIYGLSKHLTEEVARFAASTTGMSCVAARLFNTYGPHETNPHLIPHIMESLHRGSTLQLGNIHTKRDYIYVDDVAALLYSLGQSAAAPYTVVNVGTGLEYSAEEIVRTIGQLLGREIPITVDAARVRQVDKLHQRASTERLERLTGMLPAHSLSEGLSKLLAHERIGVEPLSALPVAATP
jgi:UDP-glucose 4-epimerase